MTEVSAGQAVSIIISTLDPRLLMLNNINAHMFRIANHITNINTSSNKHSKEQEQDLQQETVDDHVRRDTADTHLQTLLPT
ncbi:hypothetical protein BGX29_000085 [Mortierella sp. GBA35]|nr:hypothetical protein BGX29_000085 [Mortierella sp. GBA35]